MVLVRIPAAGPAPAKLAHKFPFVLTQSSSDDETKCEEPERSHDELISEDFAPFFKGCDPTSGLCITCEKPGKLFCGMCHTARYCSTACQIEDREVHKYLCRDLPKFRALFRPTDDHYRAILFPVFSEKPELVWVKHVRGSGMLTVEHPDLDQVAQVLGFRTIPVSMGFCGFIPHHHLPEKRELDRGMAICQINPTMSSITPNFANQSINALGKPGLLDPIFGPVLLVSFVANEPLAKPEAMQPETLETDPRKAKSKGSKHRSRTHVSDDQREQEKDKARRQRETKKQLGKETDKKEETKGKENRKKGPYQDQLKKPNYKGNQEPKKEETRKPKKKSKREKKKAKKGPKTGSNEPEPTTTETLTDIGNDDQPDNMTTNGNGTDVQEQQDGLSQEANGQPGTNHQAGVPHVATLPEQFDGDDDHTQGEDDHAEDAHDDKSQKRDVHDGKTPMALLVGTAELDGDATRALQEGSQAPKAVKAIETDLQHGLAALDDSVPHPDLDLGPEDLRKALQQAQQHLLQAKLNFVDRLDQISVEVLSTMNDNPLTLTDTTMRDHASFVHYVQDRKVNVGIPNPHHRYPSGEGFAPAVRIADLSDPFNRAMGITRSPHHLFVAAHHPLNETLAWTLAFMVGLPWYIRDGETTELDWDNDDPDFGRPPRKLSWNNDGAVGLRFYGRRTNLVLAGRNGAGRRVFVATHCQYAYAGSFVVVHLRGLPLSPHHVEALDQYLRFCTQIEGTPTRAAFEKYWAVYRRRTTRAGHDLRGVPNPYELEGRDKQVADPMDPDGELMLREMEGKEAHWESVLRGEDTTQLIVDVDRKGKGKADVSTWGEGE